MNEKLNEFLHELANLMEKYGVEIEAVDDGEQYYPSVDGIEFSIRDPEDGYDCVKTKFNDNRAEDIRALAKVKA